MNNKEKFLPIGSVVKLNKTKKMLMVIGYLVKNEGKIYDYIACLFPEGILSLKDVLLFNHGDIKEIYYLGHKSEKYKELNSAMLKGLNNLVGAENEQ